MLVYYLCQYIYTRYTNVLSIHYLLILCHVFAGNISAVSQSLSLCLCLSSSPPFHFSLSLSLKHFSFHNSYLLYFYSLSFSHFLLSLSLLLTLFLFFLSLFFLFTKHASSHRLKNWWTYAHVFLKKLLRYWAATEAGRSDSEEGWIMCTTNSKPDFTPPLKIKIGIVALKISMTDIKKKPHVLAYCIMVLTWRLTKVL